MLNSVFKNQKSEGDPIDAFHAKMVSTAESKGKSSAAQGLPRPTGDTLSSYTGTITASYRSQLSQTLRPYAGDHDRMFQTEKESLNSKSERIERLLDKSKESKRTLILERDSLSHTDYETHKTLGLRIIIVVLAIAEGIFALPAFRLFDSSNNLFQYFLLAGLVTFFIFLPDALIGIYRATEQSRYKHLIRIATIAVVLTGLYVVAIMRTTYLQSISTTTMRDVKAVSALPLKGYFFVAISLLFLVVTCYCSYLLPNRDEKKSNGRAKQIDTKLSNLDDEIRGYEQELQNIPDRLYASEQRISRMQVDAESIKQRFTSLHLEAIHAYISSNQTHRSDRSHPACFNDEIPSLY